MKVPSFMEGCTFCFADRCDTTKAAVPGCGRSSRDRVLRRCETRFRGGGGARRRVVRLAAVGRRARGPAAVGTSLLAGRYDRGVSRQRLVGSAAGGGGGGGTGKHLGSRGRRPAAPPRGRLRGIARASAGRAGAGAPPRAPSHDAQCHGWGHRSVVERRPCLDLPWGLL